LGFLQDEDNRGWMDSVIDLCCWFEWTSRKTFPLGQGTPQIRINKIELDDYNELQ